MMKAPLLDPPSDDKRWRIVQGTMRRNGFARHALIETLHTVQESFGFLDEDSMRYVSGSLRVPLSQVYGVSTFFFVQPETRRQHTCVLCTGTACYIKGAPQLLETIADEYGIHPEETTPDRELSLLTARCVGSCGLGPVAVVDGEVVGKLTSDMLLDRLQEVIGSHDA